MDKDLSKAVIKTFVKLYQQKLVYKDTKLVNWDTKLETAISDLAVEQKEVQSNLYYIKYQIVGENNQITIATTRPETMLGDTAVAVNPKDDRYKNFVGKRALIPIVEREVSIISDNFVAIDQGSGALKVTPAHDFNDFDIGKRHNLEFINIFEKNGKLNNKAPNELIGLDRFAARKIIVEKLREKDLLEKIENIKNVVPYGDRSNTIIEPLLTEQWFADAKFLAKKAIQVVKKKETIFFPNNWSKTYFQWMNNIQPWCISRQLWWGHRIPVWYHNENPKKIHVSLDGPEDKNNWTQDKDVLDTWASSWLWPFAVHQWPEKDHDLDYFYPTASLVTGPDIIFFWVARMIISGYEFMDNVPFKDVYFTSILRDENGKKFSKSLGNSPDPFDLFEKYGTDAVRFGTMLMAPQGLDVLFSSKRLEVGRNFINKLWNASRFVLMNVGDEIPVLDLSKKDLNLPELWILSRLQRTIERVDNNLNRFQFNEAAKAIYEFTWSDYCDWYIEIAKTHFSNGDKSSADAARAVTVHVLRKIILLLHPYAPFVTEEIWSQIKNKNDVDAIISAWPIVDEDWIDETVNPQMELLKGVISSVRTIRAQMNVPPGKYAGYDCSL